VRTEIISKFVLRTLEPTTVMLLEMMLVTILRALCKPYCHNRFPKPEVAMCTENSVIPALRGGILFNGERLEHPAEYFIQHLSCCSLLLIQLLRRDGMVLDWSQQESDQYNAVCWVYVADLR